MEYYSAVKNDIMKCVGRWMELEKASSVRYLRPRKTNMIRIRFYVDISREERRLLPILGSHSAESSQDLQVTQVQGPAVEG